jgi:hypothetical protein
VLATASDGCGHTNTCAFTVTVLRPILGPLMITRSGGTVILQWRDGILQQANHTLGPWTDVPGASPPLFTVSPVTQGFYRLRCNSP